MVQLRIAYFLVLYSAPCLFGLSKTRYRPAESKLIQWLDETCSLTDLAMPLVLNKGPITTSLTFNLYRIHELSDRDEKLTVLASLKVEWQHPCVFWNGTSDAAHEWKTLQSVAISPSRIWRPIIQVMNTYDDIFAIDRIGSDGTAYVYSSGIISWWPMGKFVTTCILDLRNFPFDSQRCEIILEPWDSTERIEFSSANIVKVTTETYETGQLWRILDIRSSLFNKTYDDDDTYNYSRTIFEISVQRSSYYYFCSIILPGIALSLLQLTTFIMNPGFSDRPYFSVSVVLALSVLMTFVSGIIPVTSKVILISVDLSTCFVIGIFVTFYSMASLTMSKASFFKRKRKLTKWLTAGQSISVEMSLLRWMDVVLGVLITLFTVSLHIVIYGLIFVKPNE